MDPERRKFCRLNSPGEDCKIEFGNQHFHAKIVDESINGFSIGGLNIISLAKDLPVRLNFRDNTVFGICKNVTRADTGLRIGIERSFVSSADALDMESEFDHTQFLINPFFEFQGNFIKCIPLELKSDSVLRVLLWNGKSFDVNPNSIHALTRSERAKHLMQDQILEMIKQLYGMGEEHPTIHSIEDVLDYEFGCEESNDLFDCLSRCETLLSAE